ncbi:DNA adenine methylase [Enterobacteriaceae bacterium ML5]|nr:DNA adenine methylase [Enterobacteriaceae bacterium ML5]
MLGYLGSKGASGAYQAIISQMPPHDCYIESHFGAGTVMAHKPAALDNFGIDIDRQALTQAKKQFHGENIQLIEADAVQFLRNFDYAAHGRVLIYVDPPYLAHTRTSKNRYRYEYSDDDHRILLTTLRSIPASVILSGYPSQLYSDLLPDWRTLEFQVMTRGGARTEKIWMNFPDGMAYSAAYAGTNYTDRQRIKRKAERWAAKYSQLPDAERLAILSEMLKHHETC